MEIVIERHHRVICYPTDKLVKCNLTWLQEFRGKSIKALCKWVLLWEGLREKNKMHNTIYSSLLSKEILASNKGILVTHVLLHTLWDYHQVFNIDSHDISCHFLFLPLFLSSPLIAKPVLALTQLALDFRLPWRLGGVTLLRLLWGLDRCSMGTKIHVMTTMATKWTNQL